MEVFVLSYRFQLWTTTKKQDNNIPVSYTHLDVYKRQLLEEAKLLSVASYLLVFLWFVQIQVYILIAMNHGNPAGL